MATVTASTDLRALLKRVALGVGLSGSLGLTVVLVKYRAFASMVNGDLMELFGQTQSDGDGIVTEEMLEGLPSPVRRYLRYTGIVGQPLVETVYVEQQGTMRTGPEAAWKPFDAKQHFTVHAPGFVWDASMRLTHLPLVRIRDKYVHGHGSMLGKMGAVVTVVEGHGPEVDQGSMLRYLSEMQWFPAAFLGENIAFEEIDDVSARVTLTDHGKSVTGTLSFDDQGRLTNFTAERYATVDGGYELRPWSIPVTGYGQFEGLRLPVRGSVTWTTKDGDFVWLDLHLTKLEYNTIHVARTETESKTKQGTR
jgi:hypothetical protein